MTNEKFKQLFGVNEPIMMFEPFKCKDGFPVRIIEEDLYKKMIGEIEQKPVKIDEQSAKSIIDVATENSELKRCIGDIFLYIHEAMRGKEHIALEFDYELAKAIFQDLMNNFEVIRDNFKQHKLK